MRGGGSVGEVVVGVVARSREESGQGACARVRPLACLRHHSTEQQSAVHPAPLQPRALAPSPATASVLATTALNSPQCTQLHPTSRPLPPPFSPATASVLATMALNSPQCTQLHPTSRPLPPPFSPATASVLATMALNSPQCTQLHPTSRPLPPPFSPATASVLATMALNSPQCTQLHPAPARPMPYSSTGTLMKVLATTTPNANSSDRPMTCTCSSTHQHPHVRAHSGLCAASRAAPAPKRNRCSNRWHARPGAEPLERTVARDDALLPRLAHPTAQACTCAVQAPPAHLFEDIKVHSHGRVQQQRRQEEVEEDLTRLHSRGGKSVAPSRTMVTTTRRPRTRRLATAHTARAADLSTAHRAAPALHPRRARPQRSAAHKRRTVTPACPATAPWRWRGAPG